MQQRPQCWIYLFLFLCLGIVTSNAQSDDGLRVGVVLSGGGAKGYAHVGALRVIEEAGIQVDYIGGASMGAIVGGLYAAGYSPNQLDSILRNTDISAALTDVVARRDKAWFEKEYTEKYALSLFFDDRGLSIPAALSNGQSVFDLFAHWTMAVNDITDFRQLPIPYLAVATDVVTGEQVLLEEGFLPLAMRVSGALPGLLAPLKVKGRLLTDGGLVNNFPIQEIRDRGMDIVIGVSVEDGLYQEEDLNSIITILTQISTYQTVRKSAEQAKAANLVIHPKLEGFTVTSFEATDTLIALGAQAARASWEALRVIAQRQRASGRSPRQRTEFKPIDSLYLSGISVRKNAAYSVDNVLASFPRRLRGNLSPEEFLEGVDALYATNRFNFINYRFAATDSMLRGLVIDPILRPGYDRQIRIGFHYDQIYNSSVLVNLTARNLGFQNSVGVLDLIVGDNLRYNAHYLVERPRGPDFGLNSYIRYNDIEVDLTEPIGIDSVIQLTQTAVSFVDWHNEIYARLLSAKNYSLGLAAGLKYFESANDQFITSVDVPILSGRRGYYFIGSTFYRYDNRDDRNFPIKGADMELQFRAIRPLSQSVTNDRAANWSYNVDLQLEKLFALGRRFSLGVGLNAGLTFNDPVQPYLYLVGGYYQAFINNFRPFVGLEFAQSIGTDLLASRLFGRYQVFDGHFVTISTQAARVEASSDIGSSLLDQRPDYYSIGLSYGLSTPIGPIELTFGQSNAGNTIFVNLGHWF